MAVLKKPTTQKNHLNIFADWKKKTKVLVRHCPPSKLHFKLQTHTHTHVYIRCWKVNNIKRAEVIQSTQKRGCFYGKLTAHLQSHHNDSDFLVSIHCLQKQIHTLAQNSNPT